MTTISWNARVLSGDWATASNWLGLQVPGQFDTVSLASTSAATITVGRADTITVGAITVGSGINDAISITGGALTVNGTSNFGATLTIVSGTLTLANAITLSGGTVTNGGTIAKTSGTGTATIAAGVTNSGTISASAGTLAISGALTESGQLSASTGAAISDWNRVFEILTLEECESRHPRLSGDGSCGNVQPPGRQLRPAPSFLVKSQASV
jgi:hypothetical protein